MVQTNAYPSAMKVVWNVERDAHGYSLHRLKKSVKTQTLGNGFWILFHAPVGTGHAKTSSETKTNAQSAFALSHTHRSRKKFPCPIPNNFRPL
jgi:hypothetical protein